MLQTIHCNAIVSKFAVLYILLSKLAQAINTSDLCSGGCQFQSGPGY